MLIEHWPYARYYAEACLAWWESHELHVAMELLTGAYCNWRMDLWYNLSLKTNTLGTFLVVQWLRIRLPMQLTRVWSLVQEDATWGRLVVDKPMHHNDRAHTLELVLCHTRSPHEKKPAHPAREQPRSPQLGKAGHSSPGQHSQK